MGQLDNNRKPDQKKSPREWFPGSIFLWIILFLSIFYFTRLGTLPLEKQNRQLTYGEFYSMLESNALKPTIKSGIRVANEVTGDLVNGEKYRVMLPEHDPDMERILRQSLPNYEIRPEKTF